VKVLFQSRKTLFTAPGGDTIQMVKTSEYLEKTGWDIEISTELEPDLKEFDIVHIFNLMRPQEVYLQAVNAKKFGKRLALSTIYGPYTEFDQHARMGLAGQLAKVLKREPIEYLKVLARALSKREIHKGTLILLAKGFHNLQREILKLTDVFLPNSESEMQRVWGDFPKLAKKRYKVVPNAVDTRLFGISSIEEPEKLRGFRVDILCVARIEGRKNQLNLVRAVNETPYTLAFIGQPAPNNQAYYAQVRQEAGPRVQFVGQVNHQDLPCYYRAAKVHILPSWMESPGLSSLEAGAMGCNLVVTDKGDTREYFGDQAIYCDPASVDSIRIAIEKAMDRENNGQLQERILQNCTWEKAAQVTLEGYKLALQ
jgi:glycosyltransferase involved in cell wall biosynthesis